ncbi:MAG: hypothetical protein FJ320_00885 [SAR202 cluster bacterium]|nr:hypothetical protein [SAR202 cluster bacterium]
MAKAAHEQNFEEAIQEYLEKSRAMIGKEVMENLPPEPPAPFDQKGPPFEAALRMDSRTIRNYALTIGDDNPLYTDPDYGKKTKYGSQIAPGPILSLVRYPSAHGAKRPEGYPMANFISGTAWEFYDAIRVGSKFRSSKVTKEVLERKGGQGTLIFLISECYYTDFHGDIPAKCYGTQIMVPRPEMGATRAMPKTKLGQSMMYSRPASKYSREQIEDLVKKIEGFKRRGPEPLYWEDVQVGDKVGPFVLPPWSLQDQVSRHFMDYCCRAPENLPGDNYAFEPFYHFALKKTEWVREHPITRWPHEPGSEHEDALLAIYRGQPGPFDFGVQRVQIPQRLMSDWAGDEGFIRRMYIAMRRPVFYADATIYEGEVVKKFTEVQEGKAEPGGVPGKATYHAVGIKINGTNQVGEPQAPGTATVYLPSREHGPVQLPIPHAARTPFVPYDTYRQDWY